MQISITSIKYDLEMNIYYRLTLVNSDSGTGKTSIGNIFKENKRNKLKLYIDGKLDNSNRLVYIGNNNKPLLIRSALGEDKIILLDEIDFDTWEDDDVKEFNSNNGYKDKFDPEKAKKEKKSSLWLKIINQSKAIIILFNRDESISTSVHMKAVYEFRCNGRKHWIEQKYSPVPVKKNIIYDTILTEDEKSGYFLMTSLYKDVNIESAKSKDNVVNTLNKLINKDSKRNIVVIADICAFGTVAYRFMNLYKNYNFIQLALLDIESVEYIFLKSNMFKHIDIIENTLELPVLMERYYTDVLNKVLVAHTGKGYDKGKKSKCIYEDCCHETLNRSKKCGLYLGGNKFRQMFKGTKYEYLLDLQVEKK